MTLKPTGPPTAPSPSPHLTDILAHLTALTVQISDLQVAAATHVLELIDVHASARHLAQRIANLPKKEQAP